MSSFSDTWLALREPADAAARADELVAGLAGLSGSRPLAVLDLGCGTGANLRHLLPLVAPLTAAMGHGQQWTCVDHDPRLLACLPERTSDWAARAGLTTRQSGDLLELIGAGGAVRVSTMALDLMTGIDDLPLREGGLVTASALLDLVSADWLDRLLRRCRDARCALLFVLSYDGRCALEPSLDGDAEVIELVNRHQRGDKGFGVALGPAAAAEAEARCVALGYKARSAGSDWRIGTDAPALQTALISGWHDAALELIEAGGSISALSRADLGAWRRARLGEVAAGRSRLRVGHRDLLALP
jgi:SAM-dependent methyltransferase